MTKDTNPHFRALNTVCEIHEEAADFAAFANEEVANANNGILTHPLCGAALFSISADLLSVHRAIMDLCQSGWAFLCTVLIRSMLEVLLSIAILTENETEADYRGAKYTHRFLKAALTDPHSTDDQKNDAQKQIAALLRRAPAGLRPRLHAYFYTERAGGYWYWPEFQRPSDAFARLANTEIQQIYDKFCGAAHGSYLGYRILKDSPDSIHPNPRADGRSQNMAIAISTRLLIEAVRLRDRFENGGRLDRIYEEILEKLLKAMASPRFSSV